MAWILALVFFIHASTWKKEDRQISASYVRKELFSKCTKDIYEVTKGNAGLYIFEWRKVLGILATECFNLSDNFPVRKWFFSINIKDFSWFCLAHPKDGWIWSLSQSTVFTCGSLYLFIALVLPLCTFSDFSSIPKHWQACLQRTYIIAILSPVGGLFIITWCWRWRTVFPYENYGKNISQLFPNLVLCWYRITKDKLNEELDKPFMSYNLLVQQ